MTVEEIALELRTTIESVSGCSHPAPERRYHKDDDYLSYGLPTPEFWRIMKDFRVRFLALPFSPRAKLSSLLLSMHVGELGHAGIHILALSINDLKPSRFDWLDRLAGHFRDWSHVDHFCGSVAQPLLLQYRRATLALLATWNRSPNRWKRRASAVAFTRRIAQSGEFTRQALRMCRNLIFDKEDAVRKGVGWALKDNLRSAPAEVLDFIKQIRREGASATITLYAIRELKGAGRREVLSIGRDPNFRLLPKQRAG